MPWILVSANGEELERRELSGPLVIGRSPECDLAVRDILLSRTHCRLEPVGNGWKVVDLNSKNGTRVGWQGVQAHALRDGDHLRMGRTRIVYHTGPFEPAPPRATPRPDRLIRPADPHEALTGTVTDFVLLDDEEEQPAPDVNFVHDDRPYPQPRPLEPITADDSAAEPSPVDELAAGFWSLETGPTIAAGTTTLDRPRAIVRALPRSPALPKPLFKEIRRPRGETDLSLQADVQHFSPAVAPALPLATHGRRSRLLTIAGWTTAAIFATGVAVMSIWLLTLAP
jgi:predicted component of type VI protein secretion system